MSKNLLKTIMIGAGTFVSIVVAENVYEKIVAKEDELEEYEEDDNPFA